MPISLGVVNTLYNFIVPLMHIKIYLRYFFFKHLFRVLSIIIYVGAQQNRKLYKPVDKIYTACIKLGDRDSSVCTAIRYGLDGPGIESR